VEPVAFSIEDEAMCHSEPQARDLGAVAALRSLAPRGMT